MANRSLQQTRRQTQMLIRHWQILCSLKKETGEDIWWLVEVPYWWNWGCFVIFWGNFSMGGEKYYFCVEGSTQDAHEVRCLLPSVWVHTRWLLVSWWGAYKMGSTWGEWPCRVKMSMQGENGHWGEKWPREVKMSMWGENGHVRWEVAMQGENVHMRWEWPCEVTNGDVRWKWPCGVRNGHVRWKCPYNVRMAMWGRKWSCRVKMSMQGRKWPCRVKISMQGENGHMRWEMATQGENGHVRWQMATHGENVHARWEWPYEVTNGHVMWKCPCEVRMATRATWWNSSLLDICLVGSKSLTINVLEPAELF